MSRFRRLCRAGAVLAAAAIVVGAPATVRAGGDLVSTTISLKEFKQAFDLYSVRKLIDPVPDDGVSFKLNKLDDQGNRIIWRDPNHQAVNVRNSFISFTVDSSATPTSRRAGSELQFESMMDLLGRKRPGGALRGVSCGLEGSAGVDAVTCGVGPTVSPS